MTACVTRAYVKDLGRWNIEVHSEPRPLASNCYHTTEVPALTHVTLELPDSSPLLIAPVSSALNKYTFQQIKPITTQRARHIKTRTAPNSGCDTSPARGPPGLVDPTDLYALATKVRKPRIFTEQE